MLYNQPAFREEERTSLHRHISATGLATLVTASSGGPLASHLPLLLEAETGPHGTLIGHMARANSQWHASDLTQPALAIFMGPDAYVTPSWYASKREHGRVVPTWNYGVVHVRGRLEVFEDAERLLDAVRRLTDRHEARFGAPWQVTDAPADFIERQLKGIVGVRLEITGIEGKMKLSQNRPEADQQGVVTGLGGSPSAGDRAVADAMAGRRRAGAQPG